MLIRACLVGGGTLLINKDCLIYATDVGNDEEPLCEIALFISPEESALFIVHGSVLEVFRDA